MFLVNSPAPRFAQIPLLLPLLICFLPLSRKAEAQQEPPYFVTYSSVMEEPGNLEIENQNIAAAPKNTNAFFAPTIEFEYGVTAWWTAEAYLQGQATAERLVDSYWLPV